MKIKDIAEVIEGKMRVITKAVMGCAKKDVDCKVCDFKGNEKNCPNADLLTVNAVAYKGNPMRVPLDISEKDVNKINSSDEGINVWAK